MYCMRQEQVSSSTVVTLSIAMKKIGIDRISLLTVIDNY